MSAGAPGHKPLANGASRATALPTPSSDIVSTAAQGLGLLDRRIEFHAGSMHTAIDYSPSELRP